MMPRTLLTEFSSPKEFFEAITGRSELQLLSIEQIKEFYLGKTILITGAGGTIGSAVARRLNEAGMLAACEIRNMPVSIPFGRGFNLCRKNILL